MEIIERFKELVDNLQSTSSRNTKEDILKRYINDPDIKEILNFIFNPYIVTGIAQKKLNKVIDIPKDFEFELGELQELTFSKYLSYFKTHNTGSDFDLKFLTWGSLKLGYTVEEIDLIRHIITKDIKLGVQATTLNKIFGKDFIPRFTVMLAERYFEDPDKYVPNNTEFILTTKLDGVRCICVKENGMPKFYTRQGQIISDLNELIFEFAALPDDFAYDGELVVMNPDNLSSKDLYRETVKEVNKDGVKMGVIFYCFDAIPLPDFKQGFCSIPSASRKATIHNLLQSSAYKRIREVEILYQGTEKNRITYWLDQITEAGGEGVMINIADAPYEAKRSKYLLKVKKFNECEAYVTGIEPGTGKNENRLGNIIVQIKHDGKLHEVRCGSGFNDEQRDFYWADPSIILNKVVELKYFEISNNQDDDTISLRFPVWLDRIRIDKTLENMTEV